MAKLTYGNYDYRRLAGGVTGPLGDTLAARLDGVYVQARRLLRRRQPTTPTVNNRNRLFTRGQLLFEPNERSDDPPDRRLYEARGELLRRGLRRRRASTRTIGNLNEPANPLLQPGAVPARPTIAATTSSTCCATSARISTRFNDPATAATSPSLRAATIRGKTERLRRVAARSIMTSAAPTLTSITAYRDYKSDQGGDIDYSTVDILYRDDRTASSRAFKTFSQELRLQGNAVRRQARLAGRRLLRQRGPEGHRQSPLRRAIRPVRNLPHRFAGRPVGALLAGNPGCMAVGALPTAARPAAVRRRPRRSSSGVRPTSTDSTISASRATSTTRTAATGRSSPTTSSTSADRSM